MQVIKKPKLQQPVQLQDRDYRYKLSLYCSPPSLDHINASQIEHMCLILKTISDAKTNISGNNKLEFDEAMRSGLVEFINQSEELYQYKDECSHFLLRLAMCTSDDRDWFIQQEINLLKYRLEQATAAETQSFLQQYSEFGWNPVSTEEFDQYKDSLNYIYNEKKQRQEKTKTAGNINIKSKANLNIKPFGNDTFIKIAFQEVPYLVMRKKVVVQKGVAYILRSDIADVVAETYRSYLQFTLDAVREEKERLKMQFPDIYDFFATLPKCNNPLGNATTKVQGRVGPLEIAPLSKTSFPLCMRVMHDTLVQTGKLKHEGRLQFSTFLKGIGFVYEDAIVYWKQMFSKKVSGADFDKDYSYTFRHTYGLEGKATSYSPYACLKIQQKIPNAIEQVHGCPYMWESDKLQQKLQSLNIDQFVIEDMLVTSKISMNVACGKHFAFLHPKNRTNFTVVNHPNQFYEQSRSHYRYLESLDKVDNNNNNNNNNNDSQQQQ
ncbi:DNA polymerase alpha primase subunit [Cavenderia fasciculata]|uniref:DNA polymerase alpha primase subunit n=1 Tax=Cavenderia fasciculata TaxID=261658 RepID=F4Q2V6_CACFS|nr:DNA polymerase alpha primase subunit [Cavenderia fasciculata]EGG16732.1 DNA polymerase alpha primase subunit [Cavenderia fasciculata]|eukprot:XP_004355206.1 DNA polymerase alpha primase subunit [Cavenderia fasciculata]